MSLLDALMNDGRHLVLTVLVAFALVLPAAAQETETDVVHLAPQDDSAGEVRIRGEILDYTGRVIRVRSTNGIERSYDAERVRAIETPWLPQQQEGQRAQQTGDFAQAVQQFRVALNKENRIWVRRRIMAEQIWCYRALDQVEPACDTFLLLVASDPNTQYFDCIPLAWLPGEGVSRQRAESWLDRKTEPAAVLLGASHLLGLGDRRARALEALRLLTGSEDRRVAALAEAQTWRAQPAIKPAEADRWAAGIERMPPELRAGPYYLLGAALTRQQRWEEAALALMRLPILYPRERQLSASALLGAGQALNNLNRPDQARQVYRELLRDYGDSRPARELKQRPGQFHSAEGS